MAAVPRPYWDDYEAYLERLRQAAYLRWLEEYEQDRAGCPKLTPCGTGRV